RRDIRLVGLMPGNPEAGRRAEDGSQTNEVVRIEDLKCSGLESHSLLLASLSFSTGSRRTTGTFSSLPALRSSSGALSPISRAATWTATRGRVSKGRMRPDLTTPTAPCGGGEAGI